MGFLVTFEEKTKTKILFFGCIVRYIVRCIVESICIVVFIKVLDWEII